MKIEECYIDFDKNGGWAMINGVITEGFKNIRVGMGEVYFDDFTCHIPIDNIKKGDFWIAERDENGYPKNEQEFSQWVFEENEKILNALAESLKRGEKTKELIADIKSEEDWIIELSPTPIYNNPKNNFNKDSELVPTGDFPYMIEFFSTSLVCQDDGDYIGYFSEHDYNGKYIRDAMALINNIEKRAKELEDKYADKGVKVTVNDFNQGCQYGMAIYVWIPYQ